MTQDLTEKKDHNKIQQLKKVISRISHVLNIIRNKKYKSPSLFWKDLHLVGAYDTAT